MATINKNRQKVSFYQWKLGQYENQTRRAETRTKIQLLCKALHNNCYEKKVIMRSKGFYSAQMKDLDFIYFA